MTILDLKAGKVVATVPIGANVDGNGFDASKSRFRNSART